MTYPTNKELDALVEQANGRSVFCRDRGEVKTPGIIDEMLAAITALRAQLAEAQAELASGSLYKESDIDNLMARADRAEAALAAQIQADAGICDKHSYSNNQYVSMRMIDASREIRNQPHDRTSLDRLLAEAEAKASANALRRVVDLPHRIERLGGQNYAYVRVEEILTLIPKEGEA